ncbi:TetR/AcrR family transcriptional regulator [Marinobacterium marinum]|uniref:TetR/AcrR family transcriptional regulator n=1 Tax=Marinobacterium marinum TaxID=2756129 RepID=A0A7W2ACX2_9GAMM|nr:TetR/AcrR family transcriptional regulator [Marinobacterium marinum]MBA4502588.1 TetR/AcrR family transcriptional regulator [Marinobacterium marinum]
MPWPSTRRAESRDRILLSAERLFTAFGFERISIDQVMQDAGMTRGAFYAHFRSKQELYSEAILSAARRMGVQHPADVEALIRRYLSPEHLGREKGSCPLAFLVSDIGQRDQPIRDSYTQVFSALVAKVSGAPDAEFNEAALRTVVLMVGGVAVARALNDPVLAEEVLAACRAGALSETASVPVRNGVPGRVPKDSDRGG